MARRLTRREFLRISSVSVLGALFTEIFRRDSPRIRYDPVTRVEFDLDFQKLTFDEAAQLTLRLGETSRLLNLANWRPVLTPGSLLSWAKEVGYIMAAEGITDKTPIPPDIEYFVPDNSNEANHILGYTDCESFLKINERLSQEMATWYNSPDWPGTVTHELVHYEVQKYDLCRQTVSVELEATANIVMLELLASLANWGNGFAMRSFVWEFTDICLGAAHALAINENRDHDYDRLRTQIHPGILSQSRYEKLNQDFSGRQFELASILESYSLHPLEIIIKNHLTNGDKISGLILPPVQVYLGAGYYTGGPATLENRDLYLDDWAWIMDHLEPMAQAFRDLPTDSILR